MRTGIASLPILFIIAGVTLPAQGPHGLSARASAADYQVVGKAGELTIGAEFTGHGIPNAESPLNSEDYVAVELGIFGPPGSKVVITSSDFSLKINGKKEPQPARSATLAARNIKDPEWVSEEEAASAGSKSKGGMSGSVGGAGGGGGRNAGDPPPLPPKVPVELLRGWQQRVMKAAIPEGERPLPQGGLLFFQYRGKTDNIESVELLYNGPAGKAVLKLR